MKRFALLALLIAALGNPLQARASEPQQTIVLAGGCFWGMQAVFGSLKGVKATAGYAGGAASTAHYDIVSGGGTGHAESVELVYDPSQISLQQILDVYFLVAHDPTELNRQGPDEGTQYRSEIFYTTAEQRAAAEASIAELTRSRAFAGPIVTKVTRLNGFYAAEGYHQDYAVHNPDNPYIVFNDIPKLRALVAKYPSLVRPGSPAATLH
jgi:peptide-methionine (S)-S-oxide reductase